MNVATVDVALAATDSLELESTSRVVGRGATRAVITNTGTAETKIDLEARADDIYSKSKVTLGPDSHLTGNLFALSVDKQRDARVDGKTTAPATLDPLQTKYFKVEFPSATTKSLILHGYRTRELTPGRFGTVSVLGHLVLDSGSYYFDSLSVAEGASIDLSQHDGPTLIFVKDNCYLAGDLRRLTKQGDVAIVDVSDHDLFVPNSFRGVIAAPRARITLGSVHDAAHPAHANSGFWHWSFGSKDGHSGEDLESNHEPHTKDSGHDSYSRDLAPYGEVFEGAFCGKDIRLAVGNTVLYAPPNALVPVLSPPGANLQDCANSIRAPADLTGKAQDEAYQRAIARFCSMTGSSECAIQMSARLNVEYSRIAGELLSNAISPAQFLALVRDRTRKHRAAQADANLSAALCRGEDADDDWIIDSRDHCSHTPELTATDDNGCTDSTLPEAPSADSVKTVLANTGFMYSPACEHADAMPKLPAGTFWHPSNPALGVYILSGRVHNQPAGCSVAYLFDIQELDANGVVRRGYPVAFWDSEELTSLFGLALPVPPAFIQFNPLPTDAGTRGILGSDGTSTLRFRVQAMNGAGMRSDWSDWKISTNADCIPLGVKCGN
ncbi:MAG TPA: hypothetical protein VGM44_07930 [Polyangiaceae bacterium]